MNAANSNDKTQKMKINKEKIVVLFSMAINILLMLESSYGLYYYNFPQGLYPFIIPNRVLIINSIIGIVGIYISILQYKGKFGMKKFLCIMTMIWFFAFVNYISL